MNVMTGTVYIEYSGQSIYLMTVNEDHRSYVAEPINDVKAIFDILHFKSTPVARKKTVVPLPELL